MTQRDIHLPADDQFIRGYLYEDFTPGRVFRHHWGRTLLASDNMYFCSDTMQYVPLYFNLEYARSLGYHDIPIHPLLVINVAAGMSVEDMSEGRGQGGIFLGIDNVHLLVVVYPGDTIVSESEILDRQPLPDAAGWGRVTWRTRVWNQHRQLVVEFDKSNQVACREHESRPAQGSPA